MFSNSWTTHEPSWWYWPSLSYPSPKSEFTKKKFTQNPFNKTYTMYIADLLEGRTPPPIPRSSSSPWYMYGWASAKKKGAAKSPTALQTGANAVGQREHVALSFTHSFGHQLWSECVKPNDAAAINMRQRVWVSDSCTVDQGHTVLALSEWAAPKKAKPVWQH